jgi:hypothetical protein
MTPSFESWRAAEPPAGFADRTTDAILRDRGRRTVRRRRPWFLLAAAACLLVGGAAWGWNRHPMRESEKEVDRPGVASVERETRVLPLPLAGSALAEEPHDAHVKAHVVTRPLPSASASPPSLKVPAPLCLCNAFACDCGPE